MEVWSKLAQSVHSKDSLVRVTAICPIPTPPQAQWPEWRLPQRWGMNLAENILGPTRLGANGPGGGGGACWCRGQTLPAKAQSKPTEEGNREAAHGATCGGSHAWNSEGEARAATPAGGRGEQRVHGTRCIWGRGGGGCRGRTWKSWWVPRLEQGLERTALSLPQPWPALGGQPPPTQFLTTP